jgi:hypothetical protein
MSLPQLVGLSCVVCQKEIGAAFEGTFCPECGNPAHRSCLDSPRAEVAEGRCPGCGGDPLNPVAVEVSREWGRPTPRPPTPSLVKHSYPVSRVCPSCGHAEFKARRPERLVAFTWDRVCKACGTRYTPPTPLWAGVVFLAVGLLLFSFGSISIGLRLLSGNLVGVPAMACEGFLAFLGLLAILQGTRSILKPGKV